MLAGSTEAEEILPQPGVFGYVFQCPRSTVAALWTNDCEPWVLRLEMPAASEKVDLMGNRQPLLAGPVTLPLSGSPLFVETAGPRQRLTEALRKAVCTRP